MNHLLCCQTEQHRLLTTFHYSSTALDSTDASTALHAEVSHRWKHFISVTWSTYVIFFVSFLLTLRLQAIELLCYKKIEFELITFWNWFFINTFEVDSILNIIENNSQCRTLSVRMRLSIVNILSIVNGVNIVYKFLRCMYFFVQWQLQHFWPATLFMNRSLFIHCSVLHNIFEADLRPIWTAWMCNNMYNICL